ncbi:MAG: hypothetical protein IT348_06585 [Candidatus Eisenbacteria bacterium]|nr:hypothetical protein [Candidatus Eisenbacteria bacterium]
MRTRPSVFTPLLATLLVFPALAAAGAAAPARAGSAPDSAIAFPSARDRRWQVGPVRRDRLQHGSLSFTIAAIARAAGASRAQAFALTLALGAAKEIRDARGTGFDGVDLAADAAGAALGASTPGERR